MSALPVPDYHPSPLAPSGWTERAACRYEDPDLFYPPEGEQGGHLALRELVAKRICLSCPVVDECAAYALATDERYGVWGGLTPADRARRRTTIDRMEQPGSPAAGGETGIPEAARMSPAGATPPGAGERPTAPGRHRGTEAVCRGARASKESGH